MNMVQRAVVQGLCRCGASTSINVQQRRNLRYGLPPGLFRTKTNENPSPFGLLLDVDGVLQRGKETLPSAIDAFNFITDRQGNFLVPTVFVTNAGNQLRAQKAENLTQRLKVPIHPDQVIMSHSPLSMFRQFHDRHILAVGQGPIIEIAEQLGFTQVTTLEHLRTLFPHLDCTEYKRNHRTQPYAGLVDSFKPIEAIVLFGEPIKWEVAMQLILDVLLTDGRPGDPMGRGQLPSQHLPILACNTDLLWMSETTSLPRIGHGAFLMCLETMYRKLTHHPLNYTALIGKPSEITYHHAAYMIAQQAKFFGMPPPRSVYAIGDNPESDILGANLFDRELRKNDESRKRIRKSIAALAKKDEQLALLPMEGHDDVDIVTNSSAQSVSGEDEQGGVYGVSRCYSVLVETGVYSKSCRMNSTVSGISDQQQLHTLNDLRQPHIFEQDVFSAIRVACGRETWMPREL